MLFRINQEIGPAVDSFRQPSLASIEQWCGQSNHSPGENSSTTRLIRGGNECATAHERCKAFWVTDLKRGNKARPEGVSAVVKQIVASNKSMYAAGSVSIVSTNPYLCCNWPQLCSGSWGILLCLLQCGRRTGPSANAFSKANLYADRVRVGSAPMATKSHRVGNIGEDV
jgi:hypothetical protein